MLKDRTEHPTPRTLDAMEYILNMHEWQSVLDPFCGSGTTLVAAKQLGRKAVGIEISEKYCEIAVKTISTDANGIWEVKK